MTSKILFSDVISALKEHAFKKYDYPLILSFEMHCDLKGQEKVAQILKDIMGDQIYSIPDNNSTFKYFPSPESLKNKFIIKGKGKVKKPGEDAGFSDHLAPPNDLKSEGGTTLAEDKPKGQPQQDQLNKSATGQHLSVADSSIDSQLDTLGDSPFKSAYLMTEGDASPQARTSKFEDDDDQAFSIHKNRNLISSLLSVNRPTFQPGRSLQPEKPAPIGLNPRTNTSVIIRINRDEEEEMGLIYDDSFEKEVGNRLSDKMNQMTTVKYFKGRPGVNHSRSDSMKSLRSHESRRPSSPVFETVLNGSLAHVKKRVLEAPAPAPTKKSGKHHLKVLPQLNYLYGMIGCKMHLNNERTIWHISSIDENKVNKLYKNHYKEFTNFHRKYLSRIYPTASRIDSSNYDPITSWAAGSQLVALNFQTYDEPMLLNYAKFTSNGGVGYVLKPKYLRHNFDSDPDYHPRELSNRRPVKKLILKIISGQQIRPDKFDSKEIIDPYVEIKVRGLEIDEQNNSTYRTQTVKDNGFHPVWSKKDHPNVYEFYIYAPDFCFLVFNIFDEDMVGRDKMGWYAIEFNHIQQGYRVIPILNNRCQPINHSYVFCHISIETL